MGKKVFIPAVIAAVIIILTALYMVHVIKSEASDRAEMGKNISVDIDMIEDSVYSGDTECVLRAAERIRSYEYEAESSRQIKAVIIVAAFMIFTVFITCLYLYIRVLRPFYELKDYAAELSKGNFDKPLKVSRGNYFGDFTWAFDNMRRELTKKREGEKTAIENNKTVISSLSHDIKTPIASIRAYAEAFEANMDSTPEKKEKYLRIIMEKCDEVTRLTNDLFLHSISEMNKLEVRNESLDIVDFIDNKVRSLYVDEKDVKIALPDKEHIFINADPKRLLQVFENLKNNAEKYARSKVEIALTEEQANEVCISFRDFGPGINDSEIPFITDKFFRGRNVGEENGSGLGLYIVNELVEKMGGKVSFINRKPGLEVKLSGIKYVSDLDK